MTKTNLNNYERIFNLIEILRNHPEPLTKKEIFEKLSKFYNHENEKAREKLFERDKKLLNELGFQLKHFKFFKSIHDKEETLVIGYKISDLYLNKNYLYKFSENDKEKIARLLLNRLQKTKNKKEYNRIYILYIKLFLDDERFLKKILNFKLNFIEDEIDIIHNPTYFNDIFKHIVDFFNHKPLEIVYKKKNNETIERIIFPLLVYKKHSIYYLIGWDYEHNAIRNFIIQNIQRVKKIRDTVYPVVIINDDITNRIIQPKTIEIPLKEIYFNLPDPLFIKNVEEDSELKTITLSIKEDYLTVFKDYLNKKPSFFNKNLNFHIKGKATNEVTISFKLYNLKGLFHFLFLYPDALIRFEDTKILEQYKNYINNIIKFYQK